MLENKLAHDWQKAKRVIFDALSQQRFTRTHSATTVAVHRYPQQQQQQQQQQSIVNQNMLTARGSSGAPGMMFMNDPQLNRVMAYAQALNTVNKTRLKNRPVAIMSVLKQSVARLNDPRLIPVLDAYDILASLMAEPISSSINTSRTTAADLPRERQYAQQYAHGDLDLNKQFLKGSRHWLQRYFHTYLDRAIFKIRETQEHASGERVDAARLTVQVQKMPIIQKLQLWVREALVPRMGAAQWEFVDGQPFWVMLFYLIRAGAHHDALQWASRYEKHLARTERRFLEYLTAWIASPDHQLPQKLQSELLAEFHGRIRDGALRLASQSHRSGLLLNQPIDPYKYLVYRILGRILDDLVVPKSVVSNLAGGFFGWEDDIWLQLMLVREDEKQVGDGGEFGMMGGVGHQRYALKDCFEKYVERTPISQWTADGTSPMRYFFLLVLCAQFERAIAYLWSGHFHSGEEVDAMHFAIGLSYYGCLAISDSRSMQLDVFVDPAESGGGRGQVDLYKMLQQYTHGILARSLYPQEAVQYALVLSMFGDSFRQLTYDMVVDIVLESGKVDEFFGSVDMGNMQGFVRTAGYLDEYLPLMHAQGWSDMKERLVIPAAKKAEKRAALAHQSLGYGGGGVKYEQPSEVFSDGDVLSGVDAETEADQQGNSAISLYNLAEEYDLVLTLLSRRLSGGLARRSLDAIVEYVLAYARGQRGDMSTTVARWLDADTQKLEKMGGTAAAVLKFYDQSWIASRTRQQSRHTLSALLQLTVFYQHVNGLVMDLLPLPQSRGGINWVHVLESVNSLGFIPHSDTTDVEYSRITALADHLRRDFSDLVLSHLPDLFMEVEMVYLISWTLQRSMRAREHAENLKVDLTRRSRQLQTFVAVINKWFKVSAETRARLLAMDEFMASVV